MSDNGWINKEICSLWFQHFVDNIPPSRPQLLFLDGCSSHISPELARLGQQNNIDIMLFPANLTHIMQPLDLSVFGPMKVYLQQAIKDRGLAVHNSTINRYEICSLIAPGYAKALSPSNIIAGFRIAGLYPMDSNQILSNPSLHASSIPPQVDETTAVRERVDLPPSNGDHDDSDGDEATTSDTDDSASCTDR